MTANRMKMGLRRTSSTTSNFSLAKKWLPRLLLRPPVAALSPFPIQWTSRTRSARSDYSRKTPTATARQVLPFQSYHQPLTQTSSSLHHQHQTALFHPSATSTSRRVFGTDETTARDLAINEDDNDLLDPIEILRDLSINRNKSEQVAPEIPLPTQLSPTSLETFRKCPQAFFFLYILKLARDPPMTPALARGIVCHAALEEVFDLSPEDRSLANLENLFRREWRRLRGDRNGGVEPSADGAENEYDVLFREENEDATTSSYDVEAEIEWGQSSLEILRNYYELEDPRDVTMPNPLMREMWVAGRFPLEGYNDHDEFVVRGKIDRIDVQANLSDKLQLEIIDYKTGKKPHFKYSQKVNKRIEDEQFWKMKVYALLLMKMITNTSEEHGQPKEAYKYDMPWLLEQRLKQAMSQTQINPQWKNILEINSLRLMYLTSHLVDASVNDSRTVTDGRTMGRANYLDFSLGSPSEFQSILDQTELEVRNIATEIKRLVECQSPHAFKHCDFRYCSCHELRRKFKPGSVFQSPDMDF